MEYENLRSLTHYQLVMTPRTLKTVAKYFVSISVFTFIYYSQYSWCCFMLHSLKFYLSAISLNALDKRWIFLICNGILVVIASTSGLISSWPSPGFDLNDRTVPIKIGDDQHIPPAETKDKWLAAEPIGNAVAKVEEEEKENDQETLEEEEEGERQDDQCLEAKQGGHLSLNLIEEDHHEEQEVGCGVLLKLEAGGEREAEGEEIRTYYALEDDHHQENEEDLEATVQVEEEEEEEEEHGMEKLSADELNKKFEDFIRKMKEELRIEAQQQLVVVVK